MNRSFCIFFSNPSCRTMIPVRLPCQGFLLAGSLMLPFRGQSTYPGWPVFRATFRKTNLSLIFRRYPVDRRDMT